MNNFFCKAKLFYVVAVIFYITAYFPLFSDDTNTSPDFLDNYLKIIKTIRKKLPYLVDSETGAIDAKGKYTNSKDKPGLNCAGFAKYIADGFYSPLKRKLSPKEPFMSLQVLRQRHLDFRGDSFTSQWEWQRDPYFGLDWSRNIALCLGKIRNNTITNCEDYDIRNENIWKYSEDIGYPSEYIEEILMDLAKTHPNRWYIASVNGWYGSDPELWQHHHVVCIFPYYDKEGKFYPIVFERNRETSLASVMHRYPGSFMHLVWISAEGSFQL